MTVATAEKKSVESVSINPEEVIQKPDDTMQIIWGDKTLTISTSIDPDGTSQVLKITAFKE